MSEDQLNNNMAMPIDGRESLEMVKTVGTGGDFVVFTRIGDGDGDGDGDGNGDGDTAKLDSLCRALLCRPLSTFRVSLRFGESNSVSQIQVI